MTRPSYTKEKRSPKGGEVSETGQLVDDKFDKLWTNKTREPAKVAVGVSEGMDYGAMKVSVTVSLCCDQDETTINKAGELAFYKAVEIMRDGWRELGGTENPGGK